MSRLSSIIVLALATGAAAKGPYPPPRDAPTRPRDAPTRPLNPCRPNPCRPGYTCEVVDGRNGPEPECTKPPVEPPTKAPVEPPTKAPVEPPTEAPTKPLNPCRPNPCRNGYTCEVVRGRDGPEAECIKP